MIPRTAQLTFLAIFLISTSACATTSGERLLQSARESVGKKMWFGYGLPNGKLGCAAAVCNVLKKADFTRAHSAAVVIMRSQLMADGWTELVLRNGEGTQIDDTRLQKIARPGDIVVAFTDPPTKPNRGPNAHCGIMGNGKLIYTNDWMDGVWKELDIHLMFDYYPYVRLLQKH